MSSAQGPLGNLPGMQWDPIKKKYFPLTAIPPPKPPSSADIARLRGLLPRGPSSSSNAASSSSGPVRADLGAGSAGARSARRAAETSGSAAGGYERKNGPSSSKQSSGAAGGRRPGVLGQQELGGDEARKQAMLSGVCFAEGQPRIVIGKRRRIMPQPRPRTRSGLPRLRNVGTDGTLQQHYERLDMSDVSSHGGCCNDFITSLHPYINDTYLATTSHGMIISYDGHESTRFDGCSAGVAGMHVDIPRMVKIIVSDGPEPHVHLLRRLPDNPDVVIADADDVPGNRTKDVYAMSGADAKVSIASNRMIHTLSYDSQHLKWSSRKLPSDPLALHHVDANLVFAGLRNGTAHLVDLRAQPSAPGQIVRSLAGKAIVGVKKVDDGTVPFGLAVSAMNSEMLLFDVRFPSQPLHFLEGHQNAAYTDLGWATSASDRFLFAAATQTKGDAPPDHTVNAWNLRTGQRLCPPKAGEAGAMVQKREADMGYLLSERKFTSRIRAMAVREGDMGLDLSSGQGIFRYGPLKRQGDDAYADGNKDPAGWGSAGPGAGRQGAADNSGPHRMIEVEDDDGAGSENEDEFWSRDDVSAAGGGEDEADSWALDYLASNRAREDRAARAARRAEGAVSRATPQGHQQFQRSGNLLRQRVGAGGLAGSRERGGRERADQLMALLSESEDENESEEEDGDESGQEDEDVDEDGW